MNATLAPATKTCSKCDMPKPLDQFYKNKDGKYGRQSRCIECVKALHRKPPKQVIPPVMVERQCRHCDAIFFVDQKLLEKRRREVGASACTFCSKRCFSGWRKAQHLQERICQECGKPFSMPSYHAQYINEQSERISRRKCCSEECYQRQRDAKETRACVGCGREFDATRTYKRQKYCSLTCFREHRKVIAVCVICLRPRRVRPSRAVRKCCSRKCATAYLTALQRRHALTARNRINRKKWKIVRLQVIARDGNACTRCGTDKALTVHHIVPWRVSQDDSPTNLTTLCRHCHLVVEWAVNPLKPPVHPSQFAR